MPNLAFDKKANKLSDINSLHKKLDSIEKLARGSILSRFLHHPVRYISAISYWRLIYPIHKKGKFARCRTFFGAEMEVVLPSATEIYLFGAKTHDSEIRLAKYLMNHLKRGDIFCDVGAHYGYFTLLASQLVGEKGQVFSFEASRSTYGILEKNTARSKNIKIHHRAASDSDNTLVFNEFPALFSEYNTLVLPEKENAKWLKKNPPQLIKVQGQRLDDYFGAIDLFPKIIKIDVEGAEPQVLQGMELLLKNNKPIIIMEYLTGGHQNEAHRKAADYLIKAGYSAFLIDENGQPELCHDIEKAMKINGLESDNILFRNS